MMSDTPKVAIIVLNWNGVSDTSECLESLKSVTYPNFETIVVDNGSQGDDVDILRRKFGDSIHLIANDNNYGFAGGCNRGLRYALTREADYLLLLNNDVVVDSEFLAELVQAAQTLPDLAAACPKIYFHDKPDVLHSTGGRVNVWTGTSRQVGRGEVDRGQYDQIATRDYADGASMLISRQTLERVGLLDEDYFAYWEETDWCTRARDLGLRSLYIPKAKVWHKGSASLTKRDYYFLYRRSALLFLRKRKTTLHLISALLCYFLVFGPLYVVRHPSRLARALAEARALLWHLRTPVAGKT